MLPVERKSTTITTITENILQMKHKISSTIHSDNKYQQNIMIRSRGNSTKPIIQIDKKKPPPVQHDISIRMNSIHITVITMDLTPC